MRPHPAIQIAIPTSILILILILILGLRPSSQLNYAGPQNNPFHDEATPDRRTSPSLRLSLRDPCKMSGMMQTKIQLHRAHTPRSMASHGGSLVQTQHIRVLSSPYLAAAAGPLPVFSAVTTRFPPSLRYFCRSMARRMRRMRPPLAPADTEWRNPPWHLPALLRQSGRAGQVARCPN